MYNSLIKSGSFAKAQGLVKFNGNSIPPQACTLGRLRNHDQVCQESDKRYSWKRRSHGQRTTYRNLRCESLLNSRPIIYASSDYNDLYPLTPNNFMHGQAGGKFAVEATQEENYNPHKRWHRIQQLISQVWRCWRKELLSSLNNRKKWFNPTVTCR